MGAIDTDVMDYLLWGKRLKGLSDNTLRVRGDFLQRAHVYLDMPLIEAEPGHLLRFEQVAIAGRKPESVRTYVCHLRAFYRWAMDTGRIDHDPSSLLTLPRVPRHFPRPIAEDDLRTALDAARPKMRAILTLASYGGLRCVEIAGLDWSDLLRESSGNTYLHIRHGKGNKQRTVEVGQTVLQALKGYGIQRRGPMFYGLNGRPISARAVSSNGNSFLRRHGINDTMHQLRHRYGTISYQLSRDIRMVQEQMGHASPTTTAVYTRPSAEAAAAMVAAMDKLAGTA